MKGHMPDLLDPTLANTEVKFSGPRPSLPDLVLAVEDANHLADVSLLAEALPSLGLERAGSP
jgi:hypothetical protein